MGEADFGKRCNRCVEHEQKYQIWSHKLFFHWKVVGNVFLCYSGKLECGRIFKSRAKAFLNQDVNPAETKMGQNKCYLQLCLFDFFKFHH